MTDKEKEVYMRYCKYDKEPKKVIMNLVSVIEKQQAEIEKLKTKLENQKIEYQPSVTITNSELLKGKWNNDRSRRVNRLFKRKN